MSESSSSVTDCPQLIQTYVPLPGFSPVVDIVSPLFRLPLRFLSLSESQPCQNERNYQNESLYYVLVSRRPHSCLRKPVCRKRRPPVLPNTYYGSCKVGKYTTSDLYCLHPSERVPQPNLCSCIR